MDPVRASIYWCFRTSLGLWLSAALSASSADFTWLNTPASASWNEADANWSGAASVWASAPTNNATFGVSDVKAVSANALTLSNLTFTTDGYTVGGGPLLMYGVPRVGSGLTATLTAPVTNVGVWALQSSGKIVLDPGGNGTNFFYALKASTGAVIHVVSGANLVTQSGSDPENSPAFWVNGGTLVVGGGLLKTTAGPYARVSEYGTLLVTNGVCDLSSNGEFLNAFKSPGFTTVGGSGTLILDRMRIVKNEVGASFSGVNINTGGTIRLNEFEFETGVPQRKATINLNGGTIQARDSASTRNMLGTTDASWTNIFVNVLPGGAVFDTTNCNITVIAKLRGSANDGGLTKSGSGALSLRGTNTFNGPTVLQGGTLNIVADHNLGAVPAEPVTDLVFFANSALQSSADHALDANRTLYINTNVTATFDTQGYTQAVYGVITGVGRSWMTKTGAGTLILNPGPDRTNSVATLRVSAGTLCVMGGTTDVTTNKTSEINVGFDINGGTMIVGGGKIRTTGDAYCAVRGSLLITNGVVDCSSSREMLNAFNGSGTTTVSDQGILDASICRIAHGNGLPVEGNVINVNTGGTFRLMRFVMDFKYDAKGIVNFNGGRVVAKADTTEFLGSATNIVGTDNNDKWLTNVFVYVREGGVVFDTNGKNISIKQPLCAGAAVDGGLSKWGAGTLALLNTNTYNGVTVVEGGTLKWGRNDVLSPTNTVVASSNGVFDVNDKKQALAGIGGSGTVTNPASLTVSGTVAPGDAGSFGTLTFASAPAALGGTLSVNVSTNGACDRLHVNGNLDLSTLTLNVEDTAQLEKSKRYLVASCTGTLSTPFGAVGSLPRRWLVRYDTENKQVRLAYNFGTLMLLQ